MLPATRRLAALPIVAGALSRYRAFRRTQARQASPGRRVFIGCGANTCAVSRSFIEELPDVAFEPQPELRSNGERVVEG